MKKRALTLLLALAMCLSLCTPVMAEEVTPERTIVYTTTAEERDAIFEAEVEKALAALSNGSAREVRYQYKSENLTDKYKIKTVGGFAGNQVQNGYRFPTGGGFYFSDVGGPTVQGSVNLGLPKPFDTVSFTVTLGTIILSCMSRKKLKRDPIRFIRDFLEMEMRGSLIDMGLFM